MTGDRYRIRPWADRATRRLAVQEIRLLVEAGRYHVPADQIAGAFLAEAGFEEPDSSSCGGLDADAR
ncbi:MAG TPA: hypothetical protein VJ482_03800 [Acidimicrobiia bacterium]|nr:hypothetical protein [Acidimicrobiia bacterium]